MKTKYILALCLGFFGIDSFAHDQIVHEAITAKAVTSALSEPALSGFINVISSDFPLSAATDAMVLGSFNEDFGPQNDLIGGYRSLNHFYDPTKTPPMGLTDQPWPLPTALIGRDSFTWASTRDCPGQDSYLGSGKYNVWSWQNARDLEWVGLTATAQTDRQAALNFMFRAVGQVVHLLEDKSQPQHVRNEQHLVKTAYQSPIEDYGEANVAILNYQHGMLDWRAAGFTKMKDFWDRDLYNGDGSALNADAGGGTKLGLAEFSNGNFLGARHQYPEYFAPGDVQYYSLPSRDKSTNYKQVKANPAIGLDTYTLKNGAVRKGIYIKKNSDGITVDHLSRINYLGAKKFSGLSAKAFCTINDPNVLHDYHDRLIPKAIEYSAGLLDYYFRGRLGCISVLPNGPSQWSVNVRNESVEPFSGGSFTVMYEALNGTRTQVSGSPFPLVGTLPSGGTKIITFSDPPPAGSRCVVVYKGTIGLTGSTPSDPVDAGVAIAAAIQRTAGFNDIQWITGTDHFNGSASATASGATFNLQTSAAGSTGNSYGIAFASGTLVYCGPAVNCKLTITQTQTCNDEGSNTCQFGNSAIHVLFGSDVLLFMVGPGNGTHEFLFTIPESTGDVLSIFINPITEGNGTPLFPGSTGSMGWVGSFSLQ